VSIASREPAPRLTVDSGFSVIFARISDGIGRRGTVMTAWVLFGAFSLGSGLSKTLNQTIGFRVLQGIGGSGLYTMTFVLGVQITSVTKISMFSGLVGLTIAVGAVVGTLPSFHSAFVQPSRTRGLMLSQARF
jgi:MFS family permease